jgi:hypothetical protein
MAWAAATTAVGVACVLTLAAAQGLDCTRAPNQARGFLPGPCDCFCADGARLDPAALIELPPTGICESTDPDDTSGDPAFDACDAVVDLADSAACDAVVDASTSVTICAYTPFDQPSCGEALNQFTQDYSGCVAARDAAPMGTWPLPPSLDELGATCCVPVTTDNPLDPLDYCGAEPRGDCDLPQLVDDLEGLMQEESGNVAAGNFLLTRLDRGTYCSCQRLFNLVADRGVPDAEVPVAGECIGEAGFVCGVRQREDFECDGDEIDSTVLEHGADCVSWCEGTAGAATHTCCETHHTDHDTRCSLHAFSEMESVAMESGISACVPREYRIGDAVGAHANCDAIASRQVCEDATHGSRCTWSSGSCSGSSSSFHQLLTCLVEDGALDSMMMHPTVEIVAELCPGDFARCEATDGCMEEVWSGLGDFGSCSDEQLASEYTPGGSDPSLACLARVCPAEMDACWMPSGTDECTEILASAVARVDLDLGPETSHEFLEIVRCKERADTRARYSSCVEPDASPCSEELYTALTCPIEYMIGLWQAGQNPEDQTTEPPCNSVNSMSTECVACYHEVGCAMDQIDGYICDCLQHLEATACQDAHCHWDGTTCAASVSQPGGHLGDGDACNINDDQCGVGLVCMDDQCVADGTGR